MAARLNPKHQASVRDTIKTTRIVEELQKYFDGQSEKTTGQLRAAEILLNKSLPNLQQVEMEQHVQGTVTIAVTLGS
jgi:hypothetical protein